MTLWRRIRSSVASGGGGGGGAFGSTTPGQLVTMVIFALSCAGILLFLWLSFGGYVPLKPQGYRFYADFSEATTLPAEADVRIAGVNVGKVKKLQLAPGGRTTKVLIQLDSRFSPIPIDTRAILRQKTLLGETYVELSPGSQSAPSLPEGGTLTHNNVEPTVQIDEILRIFDPQTKRGWRGWTKGTSQAIEGGTSEDLNDALGNLPGFAQDGADILRVLNNQDRALKRLVKNTGVVFGALNERRGQLRELISNSARTFTATAQAKESLAETFEIFPTFLDESRLTQARLEDFSRRTDPLIRDLQPVARDLGPTVRDLGALAPDLKQLFVDLKPLIRESDRTLTQGARFIRGSRPVFSALHTWLPEFNPVLSYANVNQLLLATFLGQGSAATALKLPVGLSQQTLSVLNQFGINNDRSLRLESERPPWERGNAYPVGNYVSRTRPIGAVEVWDCKPAGGEKPDPSEGLPPCFVIPDALWPNGRQMFPRVDRGVAPLIAPLRADSNRGTRPPGR
jgi:phospholipid/cholesterol/gamma-HCH transport system substrate-binding protein